MTWSTWRLEANDVGSNYCPGCKAKIEATTPIPQAAVEAVRKAIKKAWLSQNAPDPVGIDLDADLLASAALQAAIPFMQTQGETDLAAKIEWLELNGTYADGIEAAVRWLKAQEYYGAATAMLAALKPEVKEMSCPQAAIEAARKSLLEASCKLGICKLGPCKCVEAALQAAAPFMQDKGEAALDDEILSALDKAESAGTFADGIEAAAKEIWDMEIEGGLAVGVRGEITAKLFALKPEVK